MFRHLLTLLALIGIAFAIKTVLASERVIPPAPAVAPPAGPPFESYVAGSGIVEASSRNIAVGTSVSGTIEEVMVEVGTMARTGDPLFRLDTRLLAAQRAVAAAEIAATEAEATRLRSMPRPEDLVPLAARVSEARAQLDDARSRLAMWESVEDPRAVTRDELDRRRFGVSIAEARLGDVEAELAKTRAGAWAPEIAVADAKTEAARAEERRIAVELERLTVRAPVDGQVLQLNVRLGEFAVAGATSTPLILFGAVDPLHVRVDVDENDAWRLRDGAKAVAFVRGNRALSTDLRFVRFEPYVVPKRSLTGDSTERVDTRVLQVIFAFDRSNLSVFVGQQLDVFIDAPATTVAGGESPTGPMTTFDGGRRS